MSITQEMIDVVKQYALYNYSSEAKNPDAHLEDVETWPPYARVAYYAISNYMSGNALNWPFTNRTTIPMDLKNVAFETALQQWGKGKDVELSCMVCGTKFMGPEPKGCCSGRDCGCMGMPIDPIVCSQKCYENGLPNKRREVTGPCLGDHGKCVDAIACENNGDCKWPRKEVGGGKA